MSHLKITSNGRTLLEEGDPEPLGWPKSEPRPREEHVAYVDGLIAILKKMIEKKEVKRENPKGN